LAAAGSLASVNAVGNRHGGTKYSGAASHPFRKERGKGWGTHCVNPWRKAGPAPFRVPLLAVSAWTPQGYVSGSPSQAAPPYVHDFGSILNFTEWALGQNQTSIGEISPGYHYADFLAPDAPFACKTQCPQKWSLADFFVPFTNQPRQFTNIIGAKYPTSCFVTPQAAKSCFPGFPSDPDNDAIEGQ
jgi:hypothetical protein